MSECLTLEDETLKDKENLIDQINQLLIYEVIFYPKNRKQDS